MVDYVADYWETLPTRRPYPNRHSRHFVDTMVAYNYWHNYKEVNIIDFSEYFV